ncbi:MAG: N-acetylmuramoyl-L-alanine amidase [Phycisphaerales bacterium]|nr:N-acetylmuramoyl-L-alanine amidase [Phycisphaerales bacterium]
MFQKSDVIKTIIIDAGHGGHDSGAPGSKSLEKNISLSIALKLDSLLLKKMNDVQVIMTRSTDTFIDLHERTNMANRANGDLFISIHANSANPTIHKKMVGTKQQTYYRTENGVKKLYTRDVPVYKYWYSKDTTQGSEVYIWSAEKMGDKIDAELNNNDASKYDATPVVNGTEDTVPSISHEENIPIKRILSSITTIRSYAVQSRELADSIEEELHRIGRVNRGTRQRNEKGIWVLQGSAMPSVLVEVGYISNPEEEEYLNSNAGQVAISLAIFKAIQEYKYHQDHKYITQ